MKIKIHIYEFYFHYHNNFQFFLSCLIIDRKHKKKSQVKTNKINKSTRLNFEFLKQSYLGKKNL